MSRVKGQEAKGCGPVRRADLGMLDPCTILPNPTLSSDHLHVTESAGSPFIRYVTLLKWCMAGVFLESCFLGVAYV